MRCLTLTFAALLLIGGIPSTLAETNATAPKRQSTGVVVPNRVVTIAGKITSRVIAVSRDEGQTVKAGETLLVLDDAESQADLASAQASLALAKVELAQRQRADARIRKLYKAKSISEDQLDEARFAHARARETLKGAEAEVAKAKALLKEMRLVAPFAGVITAKHVEVGQLIQPGEALFVLEDHNQLELRTMVKEQDVAHISTGMAACVTIDALAGLRLEGKVSKIIPSGGKGHTFAVEILLPATNNLFPGMFGKVDFGC